MPPKKRPLALAARPLAPAQPSDTKPRKRPLALLTADTVAHTTRTHRAIEDDMVGSVFETDAQHWSRHKGQPESIGCPRCHFIGRKFHFEKAYPWCGQKADFEGGPWRLGCSYCKWMHASAPKEIHNNKRCGNKFRLSAFARFDFVATAPWSVSEYRLKQHERQEAHRIAVASTRRFVLRMPLAQSEQKAQSQSPPLRPLAQKPPLRPLAQQPPLRPQEIEEEDRTVASVASACVAEAKCDYLDDKQLLRGRVPQPEDWALAWAECTEKIAFRKQERLARKKEFTFLNLRKIRRKQVRIMAEARRMDIRQELSEATSITLAMDDRKYRKLIRYRCDAPKAPFFFDAGSCAF